VVDVEFGKSIGHSTLDFGLKCNDAVLTGLISALISFNNLTIVGKNYRPSGTDD
jgi:hypothetical protein